MSNDLHLSDHETLLLSVRPANSVLIAEIVLGLFEGCVLGLILWAISAISFSGTENPFLIALPGLLAAVAVLLGLFRRVRVARHEALIVTTDRIMAFVHESAYRHKLHTLKWNQFQECAVERRGPLDLFSSARPLSLRYGTPDSRVFLHVPSVAFAGDIKHYIDKVDGLLRRNAMNEIRPFVAKRRGERDE